MSDPPPQHEPPDRRLGAIDEFESMFKRAERSPFHYHELPIGTVAVVTDGSPEEAAALADQVRDHFTRFDDRTTWQTVPGDRYQNVNELLDVLRDVGPDLVVTSRCLFEKSLVPQHTLGVYVDVLTQVADFPVLLLPGTAPQPRPLKAEPCREVMVVTDHLAGDDQLVNAAARFCPPGGTLVLCHVEDDVAFRRHVEAIGRVPQINTDQARELIAEQLLAVASHYVDACAAELKRSDRDYTVEKVVEFGHRIVRYRTLADERKVDLLVTDTKDEDQLAMQGLAYALSVEITDVPQLLL